jgi:hypothetical protein
MEEHKGAACRGQDQIIAQSNYEQQNNLSFKMFWDICLFENTAIGIRHVDHVPPFIRKTWH